MTLNINAGFDSGNIIVESADDAKDIRLSIRTDSESHFFQWFHFRATGSKATPCTFRITNAAKAAFPNAWDGYRVAASYDRETWFKTSTACASVRVGRQYG